MKIVMIRHGKSESNNAKVISGSNDTALSNIGKKELEELREKLNYPETDIYISSTLSRCIDTFSTIYPDKKLKRTDENFVEVCFGELEGKSFSDVNLDDFFEKWLNNEEFAKAEFYENFYNRLLSGLKTLILELKENNHNSATIVAHSTVIKVLVKNAKNIPNNEYKNISMKNGCGYIFDIDLINDKIIFNDVKELGA